MNYQTCKKLKEAGFKCLDWTTDPNDEIIPDPTLSELIEACGEDFFELVRGNEKGYWVAISTPREDGRLENLAEGGSTPEEAVALLWLALNKK